MQTLLQKARPFVGSRRFYAGALGVMAPRRGSAAD